MKVGIIAEGRSDAAVLTNILKGQLNIDKNDIQYLLPELEYDDTTLHQMRQQQFSNWTIVKQYCEDRQKITDFLELFDNQRFIIIHLDSAERYLKGYEVLEPAIVSDETSVTQLRTNIILKMQEWLQYHFIERLVFAIAIQEIDAWVLTLYAQEDTSLLPNAKERLWRLLNKQLSPKEKNKLFSLETDKFEQYKLLTQDFRKIKFLKKAILKNKSLALFCLDLKRFEL